MARFQIADNCVPKTGQGQNSGIPQQISASIRGPAALSSVSLFFRSYVMADPWRPSSAFPKQQGQISASAQLSATIGCRVEGGVLHIYTRRCSANTATWVGGIPCVGLIPSLELSDQGGFSFLSLWQTGVGHRTQEQSQHKIFTQIRRSWLSGRQGVFFPLLLPDMWGWPSMRHGGGNSKSVAEE